MFENIRISYANNSKIWNLCIAVFLLLAILGGVILLNNRKAPAPKITGNPAVELVWWLADKNVAPYQRIADQFKTLPGFSNVNIKIIQKDFKNNYYQSLLSDTASGFGPDIFSLEDNDLAAYQKFIAPLEVFNGQYLTKYKQDFVDMVVRGTMDKDKVYGVTTSVDTLQMYYNKTLLAQSLTPRPAATWDELIKQLPYISKRPIGVDKFVQSGIAMGMGGRSLKGEPNILLADQIVPLLIFQAGGQLYDYQKGQNLIGQYGLNQDQVREGIDDENNPVYKATRFYLDFADQTTNRYSWNQSNPVAEDMFLQGNLAYILQYKGFDSEVRAKNSRLNFDVVEVPQFNPDAKKSFGKFKMESLNRLLTYPGQEIRYQVAQQFLYYLSTAENQSYINQQNNQPAAHRDVIKNQLLGDQSSKIFASGSLIADNYYKRSVLKTNQMWVSFFERIQLNSMGLKESLSIMSREYDSILQNPPELR